MKAVIGIGSNLGDRLKNLRDAVTSLGLLPNTKVVRQSSIYETKPYGYTEQPDFLNMVAEIETDWSAEALLGACLGIEAGFGRVRAFKNGPRILDLDLLLAEDFTSDTPFLRVPHPEIPNRSFVLVPLSELFPGENAYGYDFSAAYRAHPKKDIVLFAAE